MPALLMILREINLSKLVQLGVNKPTVDTVAAQLQSDSRALRHDLKLHGDFRRH